MAVAVAGLGAIVLVGGWGLGIARLQTVSPGFDAGLARTTAVSFLLLGSAVAVHARPAFARTAAVVNGLALLVLAIAVGDLIALVFGYRGLDGRLFDPNGTSLRIYMSPATALGFLVVSVALLLVVRRPPWASRPFTALVAFGLAAPLVALVGYAYDLSALYRLQLFTAMAVHTAAGLLVATLAVACLEPAWTWMGLFAGQGAGSVATRQLLPAVLAAPFAFGWMALVATRQELVSAPFATGLVSLCTTGLLAVLLLRSGTLQNVADGRLRAANHRLERAIIERDRLLHESESARSRAGEFLAVLGHELRNPLSGVHSAATVLSLARDDPSRSERAIGIILNQSQQMSRLLDDLLDVTRVWQGRVEIHPEPVPLAEVVARAREATQHLVDARRQAVDARGVPEGIVLQADPARAAQVLGNLLSNASQYSDRGATIRLRASLEDGMARLVVADEGMGFRESDADRMFEVFTRASDAPSHSGGLGLGLAIVRAFVELHGGEATAFSPGPGRGSEFAITLPVATRPPAGDPPSRPDSRSCGLDLMLVDDNASSTEMLVALLEQRGCRVRAFESAEDAWEALRGGGLPDAMVLDIGLPGMSGHDLARRVRANFGRAIRLIALSGYNHAEARARSLAAGFDHHVAKPASVDLLLELLSDEGTGRRHTPSD